MKIPTTTQRQVLTTPTHLAKKSSYSHKTLLIKFLGLGALLLSGAPIASASRKLLAKPEPLAFHCRNQVSTTTSFLLENNGNYFASDHAFTLQDPALNLYSYVNHNNNDVLSPSCQGGYMRFSTRMISFMAPNFYLARPGDMGCMINTEFTELFSCEGMLRDVRQQLDIKFNTPRPYKDEHIWAGARIAEEQFGVSIALAKYREKTSGYSKAVNYVQNEFLLRPDFFHQSNEKIIKCIKMVNRLVLDDCEKDPVLKGTFRVVPIIVKDLDENLRRDFLKYSPTEQEKKIFAKCLKLLNEKGLAAVITFTPEQTRIFKKVAHIAPAHEQVPALIEMVVTDLKDAVAKGISPIDIAAWLHFSIVYIHPFYDGNGRTARLLMNAFLASKGHQPVAFPDKKIYLNKLHENHQTPGAFAEYLVDVMAWNERNMKNIL